MMILLAAALLAAPARSASLESSFQEGRITGPDAAALEAALRGPDRAAARDAARAAGGEMGAFDADGQRRLAFALRDAVESGFAAPEVRAEAALQLGESAAWMRDEATRRTAIGELLDLIEAAPTDARASFRRHALKGFAKAAGALPQDAELEKRAAGDLAAACVSSDAAERTLALLALRELIVSRPGVVRSSQDPSRRVPAAVLEPVLRDPEGYASGARARDDERWAEYRVLLALAWATDDEPTRLGVKRVMDEARYSETNPALRRALEIWSGAMRPR